MLIGCALAGLTLAVDLSSLAALPAAQLDGLRREAVALWQPHGLTLRWVTAPDRPSQPADHDHLVVQVERGQADGAGGVRLGAVEFDEGELLAARTVRVSLDAVTQIVMAAPYNGRRVHEWPAGVANQLMGRALGRVLAHEIGHYVIAWRGHTPDGLMRALFDARLLVTPARHDLQVPSLLVARLRGRLAEMARPRDTLANGAVE